MSSLDDILDKVADPSERGMPIETAKQQIKDLIREIVDETFGKDDGNAYRFWQKVEEL